VASSGVQSPEPALPGRFASGSTDSPARVSASRPGVGTRSCVASVDSPASAVSWPSSHAPDNAPSSHVHDNAHLHAVGGPPVARDAGLSADPISPSGSSAGAALVPGAHTGSGVPILSGFLTDQPAASIPGFSPGSAVAPTAVAVPAVLPDRPRTRL
jgi:hypothetical protein